VFRHGHPTLPNPKVSRLLKRLLNDVVDEMEAITGATTSAAAAMALPPGGGKARLQGEEATSSQLSERLALIRRLQVSCRAAG
jgi:hypothetical protein